MPISRSAARLLAVAVNLAACALLVPGVRGEEPNPIAVQVKADLKDPNKPFTLTVSIQAKGGAEARLEAAFAKAVPPTRKEKGCLAYDLNRDAKTPTQYLLYERWQNLAALDAHLKTDYINALLKELGELAASSEIRVLVPAGD